MTALAAEPPLPRVHPLITAGRMIAEDMISTIVYAGLYAATHNLMVSTGVAIAVGIGGILFRLIRRAPVDRMQWMSLVLVLVFGGAGLAFHDARFVMVKPTVIYIAVGLVMVRSGWMARYMPEIVRRHGDDVVRTFERVWAAAMFATAAANAALAARGDIAAWTLFVTIAPIASKIVLVLAQYAATRTVVRRRVRALAG